MDAPEFQTMSDNAPTADEIRSIIMEAVGKHMHKFSKVGSQLQIQNDDRYNPGRILLTLKGEKITGFTIDVNLIP